MTHARWFFSAVMAAGITAGLFYFMQYLIDTGDRLADRVQVVRVVDATMPGIELEVIENIEPPEPIAPIVEEEPPPERHTTLTPEPSGGIVDNGADAGSTVDIVPIRVDTSDGDLVPLVAVAPQYPTRAAQRGIEGWCLVSFTVDGRGNVVEDSIVVVEAAPPDTFDAHRSPRRGREVRYLFRYDLGN